MRKKLKRFNENLNRDNIIQSGKPLYDDIKGNWRSKYFKNDNPITIELGCGDGEYSVGLAANNPERNYIGIDIKGDRLYQGSTQAIDQNLNNVAFLRTQILLIGDLFEDDEVDEIWLTFPDPRPKDRDEKRRLTFLRFLNLYKKISKPDSWFKFKTDSTSLFDYTLEVLQVQFKVKNLEFTYDLYNSALLAEHKGIQTKYEKIWSAKGERIKYLKFQF
ncbi:MAG: tRNA (guanosine(46)-N7)-methyltransferase TrmB [Cyclobacteriaceae bacterium]|uniref:tRNA (guanosine(46)-N7)-methyltransferase TrmB n=1 Tax=Nonlabens ulvanivorans TaxID=906888 RepID=UPI003293ACAD